MRSLLRHTQRLAASSQASSVHPTWAATYGDHRVRNLKASSLFSLLAALILTLGITGLASAHIVSKSILTESGECIEGGTRCSAAVYGPNGFSGTLTFSADEAGDTVKVIDYICVHTPGTAQFKSYGGSYTLVLTNSGAALGSGTYAVTNGRDCMGRGSVAAPLSSGVSIVVPADLTVEYTVKIAGVTAGADAEATFAAYNSIRNEAFDTGGGQARSLSVKPPTNFIIPEAPLAVLLLLTGGAFAGWFVLRRSRVQLAPVA